MGLVTWVQSAAPTILLVLAIGWLGLIFVRRAREPKLKVHKTDAETQDLEVSNVIAAEFQRFREEGGGSRLEIIQNVDREVDVPSAIATFADEGIASRLRDLFRRTYVIDLSYGDREGELTIYARLSAPWGRLIESRVFVESEFQILARAAVEASAQPAVAPVAAAPANPAASGPGALSAGSAADVVADEAEIETEPPPPDADPRVERRQRLAVAVGAWAAYTLSGRRRTDRSALLTVDWRSYALFRVGADWHAKGNLNLARRSYAEALGADSANRGALFNLAMIEAHSGCHSAAMARLRAALVETHRAAASVSGGIALDRLWYRVTYNIAATHRHAELDSHAVDVECRIEPDRAEARELTRAMIRQSAYTILALDRRRRSRQRHDHAALGRFVRVAQLAAVALLNDLDAADANAA